MSYTSPRGGRRYFTAAGMDYTQPVEPMNVRDGLANNLLHLADQAHSKVLVNDMAVNSTILTGNASAWSSAEGSGTWRCVQVFGPFDLSVFAYRGERVPYSIRAHVSATRDFGWDWAVRLCLPDETTEIRDDAASLDAPNDAMTFGGSSGWLTPLVNDGVITPSRGLIDRARASVRTLDGIGGSEAYVYTTSVCARLLVSGSGGPDYYYGALLQEFLVLP